MSEHYEDIIVNGRVVGQRLVSDAAPPEVSESRRRWVTERHFRMARLNSAERQRVERAIIVGSRPAASATELGLAAALIDLQRSLSAGRDAVVDLDNPDTRYGIQQLAGIPGMLDAAPTDPAYATRAAEILDAPIAEYHPAA